ncbi:MAG: hypothetical protein L0Z07_03240 [Planctomycetes bacterium]|nr:hypothetical protein [Planctomycetota bacterium]
MPHARSAVAVLDEEFPAVRAKLLEIAATFDRLDRAAGQLDATDARLVQIRAAMEVLFSQESDRAEQVLLLFSRAYEDDWKEKLGI